MKKLILLSVLIFATFSCSNDDNKAANPILGKWEITEERSLYYLDSDWTPWGTSLSLSKYTEFVDGVNVKRHYVDNTVLNGTYTYDSETNILITNFPDSDTPILEYNVIEMNASTMILQRTSMNYQSQGKYIKVVQ